MERLHHTCYRWRGGTHVKCKYCSLPITYWCGTRFVVHKSGWWEPHIGVCHCMFFDRVGCHLGDGTRIVTTCRVLHSTPVHLEIDYVVHMGYVKYYSSDRSITDDNGPSITVEDIVAVKAFFKLRALSRNFRYSTLPALRELRSRSKLVAFLPLVLLHRCRCCCTSLRKWGFEKTGSADFVLIRLLGDTSGSTSVSQQQFDWQLFSHGERLWVWRCSTQECFFVDNPPMTWARYFCPTGKFYWWHNDLSEAWFL